MAYGETDITIKMPVILLEKLDAIAKEKYLNRADVIIDACAHYCQYKDMNSAKYHEKTMRNVLFDLARHDNEFRKMLRDAIRDNPSESNDKK